MKHIKSFITRSWNCPKLDSKVDSKRRDSAFDPNHQQDDEDEDPMLTSCGIGSWRPQWLQGLARPVFFMINFTFIGIIQGMTGSYFMGSMSTLEQRFAFDSKISGFILIADNLIQMLVSPIIGYFGSRVNRPRMIASGELILSLSCLTTALPYLLYGPGTHLLHDDNLLSKLKSNETHGMHYEMCSANKDDIDCASGKHSTIWPAVMLLWTGSFLRGLGFTAYWVVGMPYIDDSVSKRNSPLYISLISAFRLIGPAGGFLLASLCLRFYENPLYHPGIERRDPRFIGAWWIGFTVIGIFLFFTSLPMFLFPKQLKGASVKVRDLKDDVKGMRGTKDAIKRLAHNPILVCHLLASTLRYIGGGGYHMFKTKYIQFHFHKSTSAASLIQATTSIVPSAVGIMMGGILITWLKPTPRTMIICMFLFEVWACCGKLGLMFVGCPPLKIEPPIATNTDNEFSMLSGCNKNCECTTSIYSPICSEDNSTTYFSPCFAGCNQLDRHTNTLSGCSCIEHPDRGIGTATIGYCKRDADNCNKLVPYLSIIATGTLISSMTRTGSFLLILRTVEPKDKSFAMGMMSTFLAVFAFIPYPLIFGAIIDSACLVWKTTCGKRGNCWIYDQDKFRYYLHGSAFLFMAAGTLIDFSLIFMASRIKNFYDEPDADDESGQPKMTDNNAIRMNSITDITNGVVNDNQRY